MTRDRIPLLDVYFGPLDGERLPGYSPTIAVMNGHSIYVYTIQNDDDGTKFYRLTSTLPVTVAA